MLEEKVVNDEVMSEEELDEVAGGTSRQIARDADNIRWLENRYGVSLMNTDYRGRASAADVNDAMNKIGNILSDYYHCDFKIGCDLQTGDANNRYYLNHNKMSQREIWNAIYDRLGVNGPRA